MFARSLSRCAPCSLAPLLLRSLCSLRIFTTFIFARRCAPISYVRCAHSCLSRYARHFAVPMSLRSMYMLVSRLPFALLTIHDRSSLCSSLRTKYRSASRCARASLTYNSLRSCLVCIRCAHQTRLTRAGALVELRSACYFWSKAPKKISRCRAKAHCFCEKISRCKRVTALKGPIFV
jgi:hypothetical protein